jgi:putative spermidine/putrescine transport system substrate-binding protein
MFELNRSTRPSGVSRRTFLSGAAGVAGLALGGGLLASCGGTSSTGAKSAGLGNIDRFTIATWGGTSEAGFLQAWGKPFTKQTGIPVRAIAPIDYGKYKTQHKTKKVVWDWFDSEGFFPWGAEDLFEDIDYDYIGVKQSDLIEVPGESTLYTPKSLVNYLTSWAIGYRKESENKRPHNWEEFFDVKAIPGKRCVYNWPYGMLEIALLADGVPRDKLYPLDYERAFRKYDSIRDHLIFWNSAAEAQQFLVNKGADFVVTWNNRIGYLAQSGVAVGIEWQDNLRTYGVHTVPKNSAHTKATLEWIKVGNTPQYQADLAHAAGFAPTLKAALPLVKPDVAPWLSTSPEALEKSIGGMDEKWWGTNLTEMSKKWYEWAGK